MREREAVDSLKERLNPPQQTSEEGERNVGRNLNGRTKMEEQAFLLKKLHMHSSRT